MKRMDAGLPHNLRRSATMMRSAFLPIAVALFSMTACSKSGESSGALTGQRSGERGSSCVSFMDCKSELECVDGLCGVFGESTTPRDQGHTCERGSPSGTGTGPLPNTNQGASPGATTGGGQVSSSGPEPDKTTTTTTTSSSPTTTGPKPDPIPPGCEKVTAQYQRAKNPYATNDTAVLQAGKEIYEKRIAGKLCNSPGCHGDGGVGNGYDALADFTSAQSKARPDCIMIDHTINGVKKPGDEFLTMPAYKGKLTDDQAWKVITYIRTLTL